jgi:putative ABC transport system permease protein
LALVLSGFLVVNTISALMSQQVRQIGVMKAIGARRPQIVVMYLGAVLIYSVAAVAVAVPLTAFVAGGLAAFLGGFINADFPRWSLPTNVLLIQLGVGILVPLLAALFPVFRGTAVTVREAISDYGTGNNDTTEGWFTRLLAQIQGMSRPMQLSMRNTFRRKGRLTLTLITLVLGGMLFMTVGSVRASLDELITKGLDYYQFDVQFTMGREYRSVKVEQVVATLPEVALIESWSSASAIPIRADGSEGNALDMTALPAASRMVRPTLLSGRWLVPEDQNAIVISQNVLANEAGLKVGDTLMLEIREKTSPWVVVGVAQVLGGPPNVVPVYVNAPYYARLTNAVGQVSSVQVQLTDDSALSQDEVAALLTERLEDAGYEVANSFTIDTLRRFTGNFFDIIVYLLLAMGVLIASVGALGLMGTMSTNVLERTREIGVMRAVGASDWSVQQIVIVEGVFIGWISWGLGALIAWPVGALLANTVGAVLFQTPLPYAFSGSGVMIWFAIVTILGALASYLPAWSASRLTVREVLAYQ